MIKKYILGLCLLITLYPTISKARISHGNYYDYRTAIQSPELQKMQEFHLRQALNKLHNKDLAHAWGDLAFLLCQVPNHHQALQHMLTLAPQLHKQDELHVFLTNAVDLFPEDPVLHVLYGAFLYNIGEKIESAKHMQLAQTLEPK